MMVLAVLAGPAAHADEYRFPDAASDALGPFVVAGELSLFADNHHGSEKAWEGAKALAVTGIVTEGLKRLTRERRPNGKDLSSFPSGHASLAFAMATVIDKYQPNSGGAAYAVAAIISWSRVEVRAHRWHDVLAGALLGHYIAKQVTRDYPDSAPMALAFTVRW